MCLYADGHTPLSLCIHLSLSLSLCLAVSLSESFVFSVSICCLCATGCSTGGPYITLTWITRLWQFPSWERRRTLHQHKSKKDWHLQPGCVSLGKGSETMVWDMFGTLFGHVRDIVGTCLAHFWDTLGSAVSYFVFCQFPVSFQQLFFHVPDCFVSVYLSACLASWLSVLST